MDIRSFYSQVKSFGSNLLKVGGNIEIQGYFFDPDTGCNSKKELAVIDTVSIKRNGHVYLCDIWGNEFLVREQRSEVLDAIVANIIK